MVGLLKAACSMIFWAMRSRKTCGVPEICPWDRKDFSYRGLCSHFAVNELIQGKPTDGDPNRIDEVAEERRKSQQAQYIANRGPGVHAANTKRYGEVYLAERRFALFGINSYHLPLEMPHHCAPLNKYQIVGRLQG